MVLANRKKNEPNKPVNINETPQDTTRDLRTNLDDLKNIEASSDQTARHDTANLLETAAGAAGAQAELGGHAGRKGQSSLFREMPGAAGQQLVEQKAQEDRINYQGALQEEQIQYIQQKAMLEKYEQQTIRRDREVALLNARAAFNYGMEAKQLMYSHNGALADYAFRVMQEDFELGRLTEREMQAMIHASQQNVQEYQQRLEQVRAQIESAFQQGITEGNIENAKQLLMEQQEYELKVQKEAARAANVAGILGGVFQLGGAVIGGIYGGPGGAAAGSSIGSTVGNIFNRRRN